MRPLRCIAPIAFIFLSGCASQGLNTDGAEVLASPLPVPTGPSTSCALAKDHRLLEIKNPTANTCSLLYTKYGSQQIVAESSSGTTYCEKVKTNITDRLMRSGFKCE